MELTNILSGLEGLKVKGSLEIEVSQIQNSSEKIKQGDMFVAIDGFETDGHSYIKDVVEKGARVVVVEDKSSIKDLLDKLLLNEITESFKGQYNAQLIEKFELINKIIIDVSPKTTNIYFYIAYSYIGKKDKDSVSIGTKNQISSITELILERTYVNENNIFISIFDSAKLIYEANKSVQKDYIINYKAIFKMNYSSDFENGFVMNMSLKDYYNFITKENEIIDDLFEGNIRDFEGQTVEVNKNIKLTLENVFDADFWWLNNGITMIVDSYHPLPNDSAKVINPVIVNGLQTSYTIFNYFCENREKLDSENRNILLKVINTANVSISDMIISSTNRQNQVKPAQLKATVPIQKDIEQMLLQDGIYYERRKNYYKNKDAYVMERVNKNE